MKRISLKNTIATALLLVVSGAFFACLTFGTIAPEASSHAQHGSQSAGDAAVAHIAHAQAFSLSTATSGISFDLTGLVAFLSIFLPLLALVPGSVPGAISASLFRARKRRTASKLEQKLVAYISRFVRSPEFL